MSAFEITRFVKEAGPLTKRISLDDHGNLVSDGSPCVMRAGTAHRELIAGMDDLARLIISLKSNEAIAAGALRSDLPASVKVTTKSRHSKYNGSAPPDTITRTNGNIVFAANRPAPVLFDHDLKGMPDSIATKLNGLGGFWPTLTTIIPQLGGAACLIRQSTSAGIYRTDTGKSFEGSGGVHVFILIQDGADSERFLKTLHERCWLAGFGWMMVGAAGQLLDRSIVDRMVGSPERLIFEAPPTVDPPLTQRAASRTPVVWDGETIDTVEACPPLTIVEKAKLSELKAREAQRLAPESARAREQFIGVQARSIAERTGMDLGQATRVAARQTEGILLPNVALPFDDPELSGKTVADVLADPGRFEGETLADPLEGVAYGPCKAKTMRRADGVPWINSFAHGRTVYKLRYDFAAVRNVLEVESINTIAQTMVDYVLRADLTSVEIEILRDIVVRRAGIGKRALDAMLKTAWKAADKQEAKAEETRKLAERRDPRPQIRAPLPDAPWLVTMQILNDVLGASLQPEPPMRDIDGHIVKIRVRRVPGLHALTPRGANEEEDKESRLPAPEQPLLTRLSESELAELIERHIDFVDKDGRSVHLGRGFVDHFLVRDDEVLPTVTAIATLPIVLSTGEILCGRGLNRDRGIVFRVPEELRSILPRQEDCDEAAVAEAMDFLVNEWLCDVSADYVNKCVLIAAALTVIERSLLPDRPVFWVTAARRGGGKTTTVAMILMAATGVRPAAAAWSPNEEERRKALLAYLIEALPALVWDNIPRGLHISCPHIEKACTAAMYSDRRLGVSQTVAVSAATVQFFTANNSGPKGDLSSRSLKVWLEVDRADPENREFKHSDPIGWTEVNRGRILAALYTILLGNPRLRPDCQLPDETRFKAWHRLVGSAVEHAAQVHAGSDAQEDPEQVISFKDLFITQEEDDEESASLGDMLAMFCEKWPPTQPPDWRPQTWEPADKKYDGYKFSPSDVAVVANNTGEFKTEQQREDAAIIRSFLFPRIPITQTVDSRAITKRLKPHVDEPVRRDNYTLILRMMIDTHTKRAVFYVEVKKAS